MIRLVHTCALLLSFFDMGRAATIVAPDSLATVEGNAGNAFPFSPLSDMRFQQVYASSQFPPQPILISTIRFRRDLSTTFADSVGANNAVVFSGSLSLSAPTLPAGSSPPFPFNFAIPLSKPFLYDPAAGNLLLDVWNFSATSTTFLDAEDSPGDPISRAFTFSSGVNSSQADAADTLGQVTEFESTPVAPAPAGGIPEPSTLLLFVSAFIALVARRVMHRRL